MHDQPRPHTIATWLFLIVFMVVAQATIGAITRLTESGLSIVEWKIVAGTLPPLTEADWQTEFTAYQTSPQYQEVNKGMSVAEFKNIFWWEWIHRLWARLIGVAFAVPLLFFWVRGWIPPTYKMPLLGLFALGGGQGVMGWAMVASGLIDNPAVSHYRLAAHLLLAVVIAVIALRWALQLRGVYFTLSRCVRRNGRTAMGLVFVTIIWGAFVAGMDAGLIYNEFPTMGAGLLPAEAFALSPPWINFFENHAMVQFIHRWLGVITGVVTLSFALRGLRAAPHHPAMLSVLIMAIVQPTLGIVTLLTHVALPLATLHQLGALLLILSLTWALSKNSFAVQHQ